MTLCWVLSGGRQWQISNFGLDARQGCGRNPILLGQPKPYQQLLPMRHCSRLPLKLTSWFQSADNTRILPATDNAGTLPASQLKSPFQKDAREGQRNLCCQDTFMMMSFLLEKFHSFMEKYFYLFMWNTQTVLFFVKIVSSNCCILIYMFMQDTYWRNKLIRRSNKRCRKTSLTKYIPLTLLQGFKKVVWDFTVRGSWRPNITEIFWPQTYGHHVVSFLFFWCSTGALGSTLLGAGFLYCILLASSLDPNSSGLPEGPFGRVWLSLPHLAYLRLISNSVRSSTQLLVELNWVIWSFDTHSIFEIECLIVIKRKQLSCSSEVTLFQCVSLWEYHGIF